jgi:TIR domain
MIELMLSPTVFPAQEETELTLEIRNAGPGTCKMVEVRLERPPGLLLVGGSLHVRIELLEPGHVRLRKFVVMATLPGRTKMGTANFSYRDGRSRAHYPERISWLLGVGDPLIPSYASWPSAVERKKVFICYRWSDSKDRAHLLYSELVRAFGKEHVHLDQEGAKLGGDFQMRLDEGLQASSAMLVLIGPAWNPINLKTGERRLDDEEDPIRYEIASALRAGMHLIPVMSPEVAVPTIADLPPCLRPLLRKEIAWIYPTRVSASIKRIVDDLRPHVANGSFL